VGGEVTVTLAGLLAGGTGVVIGGVILARAGDVISARTGVGGLWFGLVFLALATSLPELVTAAAAIRIGAPDLAAGDLFGSNMANMLILALVSLLPGAQLFERAALDQALAATHAISMTALASVFVLLSAPPLVLGVGGGSLLILLAYVAGTRAMFQHSTLARAAVVRTEIAPERREEAAEGPIRPAVLRFLVGALLVLVTAPVFALSADRTVELTGLGETLIGTVVLGVATSLPELVASLAALRIEAYDLAVANLFGSNALNMVTFVPLDLLQRGAVFASVDGGHAVTGLASIVMMSLALSAIAYRAKRRFSMVEPSSALIVLTYLAAIAVLAGRA